MKHSIKFKFRKVTTINIATEVNKEVLGAIAAESIAEINPNQANGKRWINAIAKAAAEIETNPFMTYNFASHSLLMMSKTSNETYTANGTCQCKAFEQGFPCKHRAAARVGCDLHRTDAIKTKGLDSANCLTLSNQTRNDLINYNKENNTMNEEKPKTKRRNGNSGITIFAEQKCSKNDQENYTRIRIEESCRFASSLFHLIEVSCMNYEELMPGEADSKFAHEHLKSIQAVARLGKQLAYQI